MDEKEIKQEESFDEKIRKNVDFLWVNHWQTQREIGTLNYKIERILVENNIIYDSRNDHFQSGTYLLYCLEGMEKKVKRLEKTHKAVIYSLVLLSLINILYLIFH